MNPREKKVTGARGEASLQGQTARERGGVSLRWSSEGMSILRLTIPTRRDSRTSFMTRSVLRAFLRLWLSKGIKSQSPMINTTSAFQVRCIVRYRNTLTRDTVWLSKQETPKVRYTVLYSFIGTFLERSGLLKSRAQSITLAIGEATQPPLEGLCDNYVVTFTIKTI